MSLAPGTLADTRILVVEDHQDSRDMIRQLLEYAGAAVIDAGSADEALRSASKVTTPDVVLTDLTLGGSRHDGLWLLDRLRASAELRAIPVIAVTGHVERAHELSAAGFAAVIGKPIDPPDVTAVIRDVLAKRRGV